MSLNFKVKIDKKAKISECTRPQKLIFGQDRDKMVVHKVYVAIFEIFIFRPKMALESSNFHVFAIFSNLEGPF